MATEPFEHPLGAPCRVLGILRTAPPTGLRLRVGVCEHRLPSHVASSSFSTWISAAEVRDRRGLVSTHVSRFCTPKTLWRLLELRPYVLSNSFVPVPSCWGSSCDTRVRKVKTPQCNGHFRPGKALRSAQEAQRGAAKNCWGGLLCFHCGLQYKEPTSSGGRILYFNQILIQHILSD